MNFDKEKTIRKLKSACCARCKYWEPPEQLRNGVNIKSFCWKRLSEELENVEDGVYTGPNDCCDSWGKR